MGWMQLRIKKNKAAISAETRSFRAVRRLNLNPTYVPIKIGVVVGYIDVRHPCRCDAQDCRVLKNGSVQIPEP
jgi:hypothetical protein